jgi:probable HAF family extracellular repeat protein
MQRFLLLTVASVGVLACSDASSPTATDPPPNFGKAGAGGITITSIAPNTSGQAEDVNDGGQVVGYTENWYSLPLRAFLWTPSQPNATAGTYEDLGTFGGATAQARAINNAGHVVGISGDASEVGHPFLWTRAGGMQDLGLAPDWTGASAWDINESGQVAGLAGTGAGQRAAVWTISVDAGGSVEVANRESLGTLPDGGSSVGFGMNNLGQVVGYAYSTETGPNRAVLWTRTPTGWVIEDLGPLPGDYSSTAYGINDQGQVVGYSSPRQGCFHAVLWTTAGGKKTEMRALETLGGCGADAWAINNQGRITGRSVPPHGATEATLWTLAPDGSTAGVQGLGQLSGTAASLGIAIGSTVGGVTQVAGLSQPRNGDLRATLWTVK